MKQMVDFRLLILNVAMIFLISETWSISYCLCIILLPLGCAIFILICEVIPLHYDILICEVIPLQYDMLHVSDIRNIIATFKINSLKSTICFIRTLVLRVLTLAFYMPVLVIYGQLHLYY
jgi:hypothetical protein